MRTAVDLLVIGGGIAGAAAALAGREDGASVALVRAAPGATAVGCGGWQGPLDPLLDRALAGAGLRYVPAAHPMPHPMGDLRSYSFAAESHAGPPVHGALVCGIAGLSGFYAPTLSRLYATSDNPPLSHATAMLAATPSAGWAPHSLAAAIERDPALLAAPLKALLSRGATHVLVPAVLGIDGVERTRAAISEIAGVPVFECLGAPPSLPGWRLDRALLRALRTAGVDIITATVNGADAEHGRITRVHITGDANATSISADAYVLATGKYLGGGIATSALTTPTARINTSGGQSGANAHTAARARAHPIEQTLIERALHLPVWIEHLDQSFSTAESLTLTSRVRTYDQPLLKAGVHTNEKNQPVDARKRIQYENVIAVGTVKSDIDATDDGLGNAAQDAIEAITRLAISH